MILNQGLDGASLIVQGGAGDDDIRISFSGGGWIVSDGGPIFAGDGCVSAPNANTPSAAPAARAGR